VDYRIGIIERQKNQFLLWQFGIGLTGEYITGRTIRIKSFFDGWNGEAFGQMGIFDLLSNGSSCGRKNGIQAPFIGIREFPSPLNPRDFPLPDLH
jgi:hypothetical protein